MMAGEFFAEGAAVTTISKKFFMLVIASLARMGR